MQTAIQRADTGFPRGALTAVFWGLLIAAVSNTLFALATGHIDAEGIALSLQAAGLSPAVIGVDSVAAPTLWLLAVEQIQQYTGDWRQAGQLFSIACLALVCLPLFFLTRGMFGRDAAAASLLLYALSPTFSDYAHRVSAEPAALLLACTALAYCRSYHSRPHHHLVTGLLVFAAWHFGGTGAVLPLALALWFCANRVRGRSGNREWLTAMLIAVALPLVGASLAGTGNASLAVLQDLFGRQEWLQNYDNFYAALKGFEDEFKTSQNTQGLYAITRHYLPVIYGLGTLEEYVNLLFLPNFVLAIIGWRSVDNTGRSREAAFAAIFAALALCLAVHIRDDSIDRDLLLLALLATLPWSGQGLRVLHRQRFDNRAAKLVAKALIVLMFIASAVNEHFEDVRRYDDAPHLAADWLNKRPDIDQQRLWSNDPALLYFTGRARLPDLTGHGDELQSTPAGGNYQWLAINLRLSTPALPPEYRLLRQFRGNRGVVAVYQLKNNRQTEMQPGELSASAEAVLEMQEEAAAIPKVESAALSEPDAASAVEAATSAAAGDPTP